MSKTKTSGRCFDASRFLPATKWDVHKSTAVIMAKLSELGGQLTALADKVEKVKTEVQALKDSLSDVELPVEAQQALDRLTGLVQAVDDINPDQPTPAPTT